MKVDLEYLQASANHPQIAQIKRLSYQEMKLSAGASVLDIGCGPGLDTVNLADIVECLGHVTGIDADPEMVREADELARRRGVTGWTEHKLASALALPFPDNVFDACRCERVTQHLSAEDGLTVVEEALRTTRPSGRVVFIDTDWASVSVHSTNPAIERRIAMRSAFTWKNGFAARGLLAAFRNCGLRNIELQVTNIRLSREEIDQHVRQMISEPEFADDTMTTEDVEDQLLALKAAEEDGTFLATVNMILCRGEKQADQVSNAA